jgi:tetratricopeptide (TPR) repeat protein
MFADAYYNRGVAYAKKSQYDQAISDYTKALEINPKFAEAYYNRGVAYGRKGQLDRAMEDYTRALEIDPKLGEKRRQDNNK